MSKHRLAIVGLGGMGSWHSELVGSGKIEGLELAGIWDIDPARQAFAREHGTAVYDSFDAVLADPNVDLVLLAVPNDLHKPLAIAAMRAGKNVVSEKPVTLSSADLQQMLDVAKETGRVFTVHQNRRWDEDFRTMKKIYDEGALGEVFSVESRVHGSRGIPGDWRGKKEHGGGMMLDWGVHILDQMLLFIPEKVRFVDCRVTHITNDEVDDGFTMTLTFESGKTALLEVGTSNFINLPRWYMLGVNGTAQIDDFSGTGRMVRVKTRENSDAVPVRTAAGLTKTMAPRTEETIETVPIHPVKSDIREFYQNVVAAIEGTAPLLVRHDQMMRVMRLMETGLRAAEEHRILPFE